MQVRKLTAEEWVELKKTQSICFLYPINIAKLEKRARETPEQLYLQYCWGAFNDAGQLVSGMENWPASMHYDGHTVGMGAIGGVATLPEDRMRGHVKHIFREIFYEMRERGELFSVLFPFSQRFYRKFGYEVCHEGQTYQFPTAELQSYRLTGAVRMHQPGEPDDAFRDIYARYASRYTFAVARSDIAWQQLFKGDPYQREAYRYILSRGGQDVAYCMLQPKKLGEYENDLCVYDFAFTDRESLHDMLGFLHRLSPQFQHVRIELPSDLPIGALLEESNEVKALGMSHVMARVVDVEKALRLMRRPSGHGAYRIAVRDSFIPENDAVYAVAYQDSSVEVSRHAVDAPCDLSVTVQTFAQLCIGYLSLPMALMKPDVWLHSNREVLEKVFVIKPRFFTDRF